VSGEVWRLSLGGEGVLVCLWLVIEDVGGWMGGEL
jgi:hypothetical protein